MVVFVLVFLTPKIYDMPVRAIFEAAGQVKKAGIPIKAPEDMIPLVGQVDKLKILKNTAIAVLNAGMQKGQCMMPWMIGTMIEVPPAAISANQIATGTQFIPFVTNDLSQMGCGSSSDYAGKFVTTPEGFMEKMSSLRFSQSRCWALLQWRRRRESGTLAWTGRDLRLRRGRHHGVPDIPWLSPVPWYCKRVAPSVSHPYKISGSITDLIGP